MKILTNDFLTNAVLTNAVLTNEFLTNGKTPINHMKSALSSSKDRINGFFT